MIADREQPDNIISRLAELQLASTQRGQNIILEQHASSFKWLMASLLALNAGGLLSISDIKFSSQAVLIVSSFSFYLGIGLALLIAVFGQLSANASLPPLERLAAFWVETALDGEFDEDEFSKLNADLQSTVKIALRSRIVGWISFLAFSVGLACVGADQAGTLKQAQETKHIETVADKSNKSVERPIIEANRLQNGAAAK